MSRTGYFNHNMRTSVHCAAGSIIRIPALFDGLGAKRVMLLSDAGLKEAGLVEKIINIFNTMPSGNLPKLVGVFTDVAPDATCKSINQALAYAREVSADSILAVGGGSVMDAAKAVKYSLHHNLLDIGEVLQLGVKMESWPLAKRINIPHIAVPTTAGSGAEMTAAAVLYNEETKVKCNLIAPYIEADIAVLDPNVTVGLPPSLSASTGMDALTHALEAIASPAANHFTDAEAIAAAQLIERSLPLAIANGADIDARSSMLQASTMAINAFVGSMNAMPVHNCAHAFGAVCNIPHGDANGVCLPIVMEALPALYIPHVDRLARALNMAPGGIGGQELLDAIVAHIRAFQLEVSCAIDFSRWEVTPDCMTNVVQAIATDPVAAYYPIPSAVSQQIVNKALGNHDSSS